MKKLSYILVFSTAFYLGNITPVKLPEPDLVIKKIEGFVNKLNRQKKTIRKELKTGLTQNAEKVFFISLFEKHMIELVNQQRELNGKEKLKYSKPGLFETARQHSREMMELGYFSHTSPVMRYETLMRRLKLAGAGNFKTAGENISFISCCGSCIREHVEAQMFGGKLDGIKRVNGRLEILTKPFRQGNCYLDNDGTGLMGSPGHKANILSPDFEFMGIGIVEGDGVYQGEKIHGMWATQVFGTF